LPKWLRSSTEHQVCFVAVTQQFNTTTSMGRLTLKVLLSFAQFEREVTGERIRDKIAASKRKGMWMGGLVPLGYEVRDRQLAVVDSEAATVRHIFQRYCELGSVRLLKEDLDRDGLRSKLRVARNGSRSGEQAFSRGALYTLLSNPFTSATSDTKACGLRASISRSLNFPFGTRPRNFCASIRFGPMTSQSDRCPVRWPASCSTKKVNG
jgi:hypothetical protein